MGDNTNTLHFRYYAIPWAVSAFYTSDNARSFIADVMDGYFPAEFKDKYPDGVAFEIKDSSDKTYDDQMKEHEANEESGSFKVFGGVGKTLNSPKMKTQEFLNRYLKKSFVAVR